MLEKTLVGREPEQKRLKQLLHSDKAEFIAVYGRRRIGKTFLIKEFFRLNNVKTFYVMGEIKATKQRQLALFQKSLEDTFAQGVRLPTYNNWNSAFEALISYIKLEYKRYPNKNILIFLDELPWLAAKKTSILRALDHAWNTELKDIPTLKLVVCGSAATWMIQNIIQAKGGLHNRITETIHLQPFSLLEVEEFLKARHFHYTRSQIVEIFLALGGVPYYIDLLEKGLSPSQNISSLCFGTTGLVDEFSVLFKALFENSENHYKIVRALFTKNKGLTRQEIVEKTKIPSGGRLKTWLTELEQAGFISQLPSYSQKQKDTTYKIIDEFILFYMHWMQKNKKGILSPSHKENYWHLQSQTQEYTVWSGYAFENLCLKHHWQIKKALGISHIIAQPYLWSYLGTKNEPGTQIDLLFDRADNIISLCEIKYNKNEFKITKDYAQNLEKKINLFRNKTKTRKSIFLVFITNAGMFNNEYKKQLVSNELTLDDLFA
ncbi:MAG: ATP-binding protein [Bdellovibrionota bacterium]